MPSEPAQTSRSSGAARQDPVTQKGDTSLNTRPFELKDGDYTAKWTASLKSDRSSCYFGGRMHAVSTQGYVETIANTTLSSREKKSDKGETQIYGVEAGRYYLDMVTTGCSWTVTIEPQR